MTAPAIAPPTGRFTIAQAADHLGVKPWEVVRLIESGRLDSLVYVSAASLATYAQEMK